MRDIQAVDGELGIPDPPMVHDDNGGAGFGEAHNGCIAVVVSHVP
jgi:hypothetical protein